MKEHMNLEKHFKTGMNPTSIIALSFLLVILVGSLLLCLPIANQGKPGAYIDNLFTAVSATCVTGLVTMTTASQFSVFGQIVILAMIQIGGLGFITFLSLVIIRLRKKLTLTNKLVIQEAINQKSMMDLPFYVRYVIYFTFGTELIGIFLLSLAFVPKYGFGKGLYYSIFHSISAYCNAGFDILGSDSLIPFQTNPIVSLTIAFLIIAGGLGFVVWFDFMYKFKETKRICRRFKIKKYLKSLSLHTKLAVYMTGILLVSGTVLFYLFEYSNVLKGFNFGDSVLISFFQSTTLRTAGFASVPMEPLKPITKLFMSAFMFIGGSPAGTAGGVKTITVAAVSLLIINMFRGNDEVNAFGRRLKKRIIIRAFALLLISMVISICAIMVLSITETVALENIIFEVFSAFGTVGLTAGLTPSLSIVGKIVIMILMYIGRIGPITIIITLSRKSHSLKANHVVYPDEDILIG